MAMTRMTNDNVERVSASGVQKCPFCKKLNIGRSDLMLTRRCEHLVGFALVWEGKQKYQFRFNERGRSFEGEKAAS